MDQCVNVFVEIEKDSNLKYELDKESNKLILDRILPYPYYYPYCYGFIENTLASDNDELDALIITDSKLGAGEYYSAYIIGVLIMEDEKGLDEKILCILKNDYETINNISDLSNDILENIHWFFTNYKSKSPNKWSVVHGYQNKDYAISLYDKYFSIM